MTLFVIILLTIGASFLAGVEEELYEAFSGDWMQFDEEQNPSERERLELENEEFDWGHNVRNYMEE